MRDRGLGKREVEPHEWVKARTSDLPPENSIEEQIIGVLKESEAGAKTSELCRKHGMSEASFYKWRAKYAGLTLNELKRLRSLEEENRRLKQIVAQQALDNWALKELLSKNF